MRRAISCASLLWILSGAVFCGCDGRVGPYAADTPVVDLSRDMQYFIGEVDFDGRGEPLPAGRAADTIQWQRYNQRRPLVNRHGTMTLWVRVNLPRVNFINQVLFLPGGSYLQNFELFLDGKKIYRSDGRPQPGTRSIFLEPHMIPIGPGAAGRNVYLRFQAGQRGHVGLMEGLYLSTERAVLNRIVREQTDRMILGFVFIFAGLVSFAIFVRILFRRRDKSHGILAFSLMSLSMGILSIFSSDLATLFFVGPQLADHVTLVAIVVFPIGLFLFIDRYIGPGFAGIIRRSWQIFLILALAAVVVIALKIPVPPPLVFVVRTVLFIVALAAALVEMVRAIFRGRRGARTISIGLMIFGFYVVIDGLMKVKVINHRVIHFHWGYFIMMILLGWLLYRKFEENQEKLRDYSRELEEKSASLQDLNRTLEERVQDRTEELQARYRDLHNVNQELAGRNRTIENEISLARKIQQQLIPAAAPRDCITALYRPMDQVGGDFYDFIPTGADDTLGIFISDVSGHGIPAALITSMVKTIILQAGDRREDPASLFLYINELLYGKTGDNFITAFYGLLDFAGGGLTWCSAGHNPPFIISPGGVTTLTGKRSLPIASMDNHSLEKAGKLFRNDTTTLAPGTKLLLYTDGLTEAINPDSPSTDFEGGGMMDVLARNRDQGCGAFVRNLYQALVAFRGNDNFDDDVCVICVDI